MTAELIIQEAQNFQAALLTHDDLCFDIVVYQIATSILRPKLVRKCLLSMSARYCPHESDGIDQTVAYAELGAFQDTLNLDWLDSITEEDRFTDFLTLTASEKSKILTYCVSVMAFPSSADEKTPSISYMVERLIDFQRQNFTGL